MGQLRQLPLAEDDSKEAHPRGGETSMGRSTAFVALGLIATASFLVAGFCGIRWGLIDTSFTTEEHIATYREQYSELSPAQLIREYEQMEEFSIELAGPFKYKQEEIEKKAWGRNASIAAVVGGLAILGAFAVTTSQRRNRT